MTWIGTRLSLDHKGKKDGETLKADVGIFGNPRARQPLTSESSDGSTFSTLRSQKHFYMRVSVDWVHPIGKDQILSLGGNAGWGRHPFAYDFTSNDEDRFGPDFEGRFTARETDASAYGTFQKRFGTWTVMPGFRFDGIDRTVSSPGRPSIDAQARLSVSDAPHRASADEDGQHDIELFQAGCSAGVRGDRALSDRHRAAGDHAGQSAAARRKRPTHTS